MRARAGFAADNSQQRGALLDYERVVRAEAGAMANRAGALKKLLAAGRIANGRILSPCGGRANQTQQAGA